MEDYNKIHNSKKCPRCGNVIRPQPVGWTDDEGNYNYEHTECPLDDCSYIFKANEL